MAGEKQLDVVIWIGVGLGLFFLAKFLIALDKTVDTVVDGAGEVLSDFNIITPAVNQKFKDLPFWSTEFYSKNGSTGIKGISPKTTAVHIANRIYNAKTGAIYTDDAEIIKAFKSLKNQCAVSYMCKQFYATYSKSLPDYFYSLMTNDKIEELYNYLKALPLK